MSLVKKYWNFILPAAVILILLAIGLFFLLFNPKSAFRINQGNTANNESSTSTSSASNNSSSNSSSTSNEPNTGPIKSIGVNLDYYNSTTNRAGDFLFTKQKLQFSRVFMPYGF